MSLRNLYVVKLSKKDFGQVLLYRTFPTVEKRYIKFKGKDYLPLPPPHIFTNSLLTTLVLSDSSKQFVEWRDKASEIMQLPVVEVTVGNHVIWPAVAIVQSSYLVCCLPYVEISKDEEGSLLKLSAVSVGFSVLLGILNVIGHASSKEDISLLKDLNDFITISLPFGTPSDVDLSCLSYTQNIPTASFTERQPAWKPVGFKGKQQIYIKITEFIRCAQCDTSESICNFEVFGQISVKADLESNVNDVTVCVNNSDTSQPLQLESVLVHPCVQMLTGPSFTASSVLKRLRFSPPLHEFLLLHYCSPEPKDPPILGVFKMLGENSVELLIQLKLNERVKNNFDFCDVIVVFFNRGPIKNIEFNTNHGTVRLLDDKHTLKWSLGTKFPKDLETAITAKLDFAQAPVLPQNDPFCVGKNCYAQINFKQSNTTLSGCNIDPKSVTVSRGAKAKTIISRSFQTTEYRIWNKYGDLPFPVFSANKYNELFK